MAAQAGFFTLQQFTDGGFPLIAGRLYTYAAGTTTFKTAYTDQAGAVPHTYTADGLGGSYIALNTRGEIPAPLYLTSGSYDIALKRADGTTVWTRQADPTAPEAPTFNYATGYLVGTIGRWLQDLALSTGSGFMGWIRAATGAVLRTVQSKLHDIITPMDFGAVGDGVTDDTAALAACFSATPAYGTIHLGGKTFKITQPIPRTAVGVAVRGGKMLFANDTLQFFYAFTASDSAVFDGVTFTGSGVIGAAAAPRYQGGIVGGNTGYPSPMNVAPANYVTIRSCIFEFLTVGIWTGGASADAVPTGWMVSGNIFRNIVGWPGQSEGYGILFTPSNNGAITGNTFKTIRRHGIYIAGESSHNLISNNIIDGCDNIGIQSNTGITQNYADGNIYTGNNIKNLTRSIAYGYRSCIGIGLYGKISNALVQGNRIFGPLDNGIDTAGELAGAPYSDRISIIDNHIVMDVSATDSAIRIDGLQSGVIRGNQIMVKGPIYGVLITTSVGTGTQSIDVVENSIETLSASAVAFRVVLTGARTVKILRNALNGFSSSYGARITDTSTAGIVKTDLNSNVGYYGNDADFTHNSGGTVTGTDCASIRHAGTLTAVRAVTLANTNVPVSARLRLMRPGGGAFALNVTDGGGGVIRALSTGQWGDFGWNGASWELLGFGSL